MKRAMEIFSNAKNGLDILVESMAPPEPDQSQDAKDAAEAYFDIKKRGGRLRILTKIDEKNMAYCKELTKSIEIRHHDETKGNFAINDSEYMSSPTSTSFQPNTMVTVIYSNAHPLVEQNRKIFETLWSGAEPAEERIKEIEEGTAHPKFRTIRDAHDIQKLFVEMVEQAKNEILLILPTVNAFHREERIGVIEALQTSALEGKVKISMITPNSSVQETLQALNKEIEAKGGRNLVSHRLILEAATPNTVTIVVVDGNASLVIEQKDDSQADFGTAIGIAIYSTRNSTVLANIQFFKRMWEDIELREREEVVLEKERRSRKAAELLQDILAHDIRNYNQIVLTSAEMLNEAGLASNERQSMINSILKAIGGSTDLIDRGKKLGRILSQSEIELIPVDVEKSLQTSVALIVKAFPEKSINLSASVKSGAHVLADDLLEEVFTNILSNSVNYTEGDVVPVEVQAEEAEGAIHDEKRGPYWKITFTDHGRGIRDEMKKTIFTRYLSTAAGAGLGLSIVHALVVERYSGNVAITDRVVGDYKKGTKVELWLRRVS
ncbi:MAG TPA: HAMP domain-containing sensor histidine kinase [Candidatus Bathyarchaeia archaeon]|nr:HAMP domain-containing sensor histidine kinase [Candidatus Bathyarchaeia archaeon]